MSGSGDVCLMIFITTIEYKCKIWLHSVPERLKEPQQRKEKERSIPLQKTVRVEVKSKVIPMSFLKIVRRGSFVGAEEHKKKVELVGDQSLSPEVTPRSKRRANEISGEEQPSEKQWIRVGCRGH